MTDQYAELLRSAHHEAGHLVAVHSFGRPIVSHSIDHSGNSANVAYWPTAHNAVLMRETLVILSAGPVAAMIFDPTADRGDADDTSQLIETGWTLIGRAYGTAEMHDHELRLAERRAAKLIRDNWQHVEQVAHSLVTHHRLVAGGPSVQSVGDLDSE